MTDAYVGSRLLFASLLVFGVGIATVHAAILNGWPLVTGAGAVLIVTALIAVACSCIGLFAKGFIDAWERES